MKYKKEIAVFHETDVVVVGGVAAGLSSKLGIAPRGLTYATLEKELLRQNAYLRG